MNASRRALLGFALGLPMALKAATQVFRPRESPYLAFRGVTVRIWSRELRADKPIRSIFTLMADGKRIPFDVDDLSEISRAHADLDASTR